MAYTKGKFAGKSEEEIKEAVRKQGFEPLLFHNGPGDIYSPHQHPETKLLVFLEGSMQVRVSEETFECSSGDELLISGNVTHSAVAGPNGCIFLWSEK